MAAAGGEIDGNLDDAKPVALMTFPPGSSGSRTDRRTPTFLYVSAEKQYSIAHPTTAVLKLHTRFKVISVYYCCSTFSFRSICAAAAAGNQLYNL